MSSHRYWRVVLKPQNPSNGVQLSTIELRTVVGGADVAASATRAGTHGSVPTWFDGNDATDSYQQTFATQGDCFVTCDFGSPVEINQIRLRSSTSASLTPNTVQLWHSNDAVNWQFTSLNEYTATMGANTTLLLSGWTFGVSPAFALTQPAIRAGGYEPPATNLRAQPNIPRGLDMYHGGRGRVSGTVKEKGTPSNVPLQRRVRLFRERDGHFIRETWSDPTTGAYLFDEIDASVKYTVVSYDYTGNYRAVIGDNITPDPMP